MSGDLIWCVGRKRVPESCPLPLVVLSESHRVSSAESHIGLLGEIAGFFCPGRAVARDELLSFFVDLATGSD